jgi:tetratricopeptide (TPR) repeat protein
VSGLLPAFERQIGDAVGQPVPPPRQPPATSATVCPGALSAAAAADAAYRQALDMFERTLGASHYEVGMTCANLAVCAAATGEAADSLRLYNRALTILAVLLADQGNLREALLLLERAVAALATSLPAGHPRRVDLRGPPRSCPLAPASSDGRR